MSDVPRRPGPRQATEAFLDKHFPDALAAILGGSAIRGEATKTSDLDVMVIAERPEAPYCESFLEFGWLVEVIVSSSTTYRDWFELDEERREPTVLNLCSQGVIVRDQDSLARDIQREATELLSAGPAPLGDEDLAAMRFLLTNLLMDLEGARTFEEKTYTVIGVVPVLADLICAAHRQWRGEGKWTPKAIRAFSPILESRFTAAIMTFHQERDAEPLMCLADEQLEAVGGRLFEGFSLGKSESASGTKDALTEESHF